MRNPFKDFLYFSQGERRGILVLVAGIISVFLLGCFYTYYREKPPFTGEELHRQALADAEYKAFAAGIREVEKQQRKAQTDFRSRQVQYFTPVPFNPNTADSATFRRLGLPGWMAHNILKYRSKGGKFRKAEDFKKIYGLSEAQYQALLPYLYIAHEDTAKNIARLYLPRVVTDSVPEVQTTPYKYSAGTVIDLNRADTTELKKIPGIGSGIARLITGYRQRLGGFYRIEQLEEIRLDYHQLQSWLRIDTKGIRLINLNRSGVDRLRNHPYINFYQAKAIVEYRKKKGTLRSLKPFTLYEEFSEADLERISHYVCFE